MNEITDIVEMPVIINSKGEIIYDDSLALAKLKRIQMDTIAHALEGRIVHRKMRAVYTVIEDATLCDQKNCWRPAGHSGGH